MKLGCQTGREDDMGMYVPSKLACQSNNPNYSLFCDQLYNPL